MGDALRACLSVDVEQDCPPYLTTYRGIEQGMPVVLDVLAECGVAATFFVTGDVARRYPNVVRQLVAAGHELGCHGDTHRCFDDMTPTEAKAELTQATNTLREFATVRSFRAPNLRLPTPYLELLRQAAFRVDSSQARYKWPLFAEPVEIDGLLRVPASMTSSVLRLPVTLRDFIFARLRQPVVLFVHPWEFVDLRHSSLRLDCRFRTGDPARRALVETIAYFQARGHEFMHIRDFAATSD